MDWLGEVPATYRIEGTHNLAHRVRAIGSRVLRYARASKLDTRYDFWTWNCEHFVFWALDLEPQSPQRDGVVSPLALACWVMSF